MPSTDKKSKIVFAIFRVLAMLGFVAVFISGLNPSRVTSEISQHTSLFTSAVSAKAVIGTVILRLIDRGLVTRGCFYLLMVGSSITVMATLVSMVGTLLTFGNDKLKKRGTMVALLGNVVGFVGLTIILVSWSQINKNLVTDLVTVMFPNAIWFYFAIFAAGVALSVCSFVFNRERWHVTEKKSEMKEKYILFIYLIPTILVTFLFSYLPLWGWRYAFFDYTPGSELTMSNFVGFKWFVELFSDKSTLHDFLIVMRNTLIMSGLGILTSFFPALFAVFFSEIKNNTLRKIVQTLSTLPNFISWVLVYAFALAMFSTDGFLNTVIGAIAGSRPTTNYLQSASGTWIKMLLWGVWKSVGWGAIIYIAAISGIDSQLYEAAAIDGAKRWDRIVHITIPAILPTYSVMLLMSFAGILSNGLEQYLVFENPINREQIRVLDLYVYRLGLGTEQGSSAMISLSTVISMGKSLISILLLFGANSVSKKIRGESVL